MNNNLNKKQGVQAMAWKTYCFPDLFSLEKRMQPVLLDAFIQTLVYTLLTRFLKVIVLCRYFYEVDSHQVVSTRNYVQ